MDELPEKVMSRLLEDAWLERCIEGVLTAAETVWLDAYILAKRRLIAAIDTDTACMHGTRNSVRMLP